VGRAVSHGWVRLRNEDIAKLYAIVSVALLSTSIEKLDREGARAWPVSCPMERHGTASTREAAENATRSFLVVCRASATSAALFAFLTLLGSPPSFAADDPQEPARPGLVKRAVASFLSDDEAGTGRGLHVGPFYPRVQLVTSGAGLSPMVHFWAPDIGGTHLDVHASAAYSIYRYQYYDLQVGRVPHVGQHLPRVSWGSRGLFPLADVEKSAEAPGFGIYASAQYRDFPREVFYGIGAASLRLDRTDYRLRDGLYEGIVRYRVKRLSFMARAGLLQGAISPGTDPSFLDTGLSNDEGTAPGILRSPDFLEASGGAWLELRDQPRNPHRGAALGVAFSRFDDRHAADFGWNRVVVDAREYIPLGSNRHVIALRQVTSLAEPDSGSRVPFYMQSTLGGSMFLGGYSSARYRGDKLLALEGEYRFELHPKVELALIYEAGKVFPTMRELDFRDLLRSWGGGVRLKSLREVRLRLDVLHSVEGTRMDFKLSQSF
jgi:hypothetical protein